LVLEAVVEVGVNLMAVTRRVELEVLEVALST